MVRMVLHAENLTSSLIPALNSNQLKRSNETNDLLSEHASRFTRGKLVDLWTIKVVDPWQHQSHKIGFCASGSSQNHRESSGVDYTARFHIDYRCKYFRRKYLFILIPDVFSKGFRSTGETAQEPLSFAYSRPASISSLRTGIKALRRPCS